MTLEDTLGLKTKADMHKKVKLPVQLFFSALKTAVAYIIITYVDYGIFIVLAYLFYLVESQAGLQFLNAEQTNHHIGTLYSNDGKSSALQEEVIQLKKTLEDYDERLTTVEIEIDDDGGGDEDDY